MADIKQLRQAEHDLRAKGRAINDMLKAEGRDPTPEEDEKLDAILAQIGEAAEAVKAEEARMDRARAFTVTTAPGEGNVSVTGGRPRLEDDPKRGFVHFGEFLTAVKRAARAGGDVDERLRLGAAPTTYGNEAVGADGGFLVPVDYSQRLYDLSLEQDALLPLTDNDPVSGNGMSFPAAETTPWGTNGVRAYWEAEASQATQTKPVLDRKELRLRKLFALVPVTEELLADSAAIGGYVERKAAESIRWKTNEAIVNGTGAGQPLGITASSATVSQAKETSQTAATINATNIAKMYARCIGPNMGTWLINPDAYNQLIVMTIGDQPIWTAPTQGMASAPGGLLLGRPVLFADSCATLGTVNDIIFGNFAGYKTITKAGGIQTATSMHLWFDYDVSAFRMTFRVDGMPWLSAAISPAKGSVTRSHFVTLATRA